MKNNKQLEHGEWNREIKKFPIVILIPNLHSPENVGSIFRIADALGVEKIYLSGNTPIPPNKKIKKTARSTENIIPFEYKKNPMEFLEEFIHEKYRIISLEITSNSDDINTLKIKNNEKICLIIGAENTGIPDEMLSISDDTVHISMYGKNSSMNVATACGIACYKLVEKLIQAEETGK